MKTWHRRYPQEDVAGDGTQILMPGLIDAHTHGAGLSYVQRGVTLDYLENALLKFATAFQLQPETTASSTRCVISKMAAQPCTITRVGRRWTLI